MLYCPAGFAISVALARYTAISNKAYGGAPVRRAPELCLLCGCPACWGGCWAHRLLGAGWGEAPWEANPAPPTAAQMTGR